MACLLCNFHQKWTTDEELASSIQECGVTDLVNIKFFENRANGQSKGWVPNLIFFSIIIELLFTFLLS